MSAVFTVDFDPKKMIDQLDKVSPDKWSKILSDAQNETGFYVLAKYKKEMSNYIDRPVPYTINSMYLKKATGPNLEASVQWKDSSSNSISAGHYLQPEVFGGNRSQKKMERALQAKGLIPNGWVAVPTKDAPKDSYGNVPNSFINQILSFLNANTDYQSNQQIKKLRKLSTVNLIKGVAKAAVNQSKLAAREKRAAQKAQKYFTAIKGRKGNPLPSGIYERTNAFGVGIGASIKRIFNFVPIASYKVTFPFYDIGTQAAQSKFPSKLDEAIQKALKPT